MTRYLIGIFVLGVLLGLDCPSSQAKAGTEKSPVAHEDQVPDGVKTPGTPIALEKQGPERGKDAGTKPIQCLDPEKAIIVLLLIVAGLTLLMMPLLRYVIVGWRAKRKDIMDGLDADARKAYFKMFSRSAPTPDPQSASDEFERLYTRWYGRRFFLLPGLLFGLVGFITVTLVVLTVLHRLDYMANQLFDLPDTAMTAIAGAYLWVVNDHISRARRLDFSPSDVLWGVLRLIIAVPMGYAFAAIAAESIGPFIAFALGTFPLEALNSMLRKLAEKKLDLGASEKEERDDIIQLQGVNKAIVERLLKEDIATVTQVAYCDPVRLVMRSNLSFNFVTDCMNQALAWMYFQEDLQSIRSFGMRGAVEIKNLIDAYDDRESPGHEQAVAAFPKIAAAINKDEDTLQLAFREIAGDPYTVFLQGVWT